MVYESDFYTTRRPYSRPLASSYSITTTPVVLPLSAVIQLRGYLPRMPYIAHKRLVTVIHSPVHNVYYSGSMIPIRIHSRVRPSVIAAELKRIRDLPRPSTESYTEHYLNSKDHIYFDDEAKEIRARVDSLLRRVHVYIPRACPSDFAEEIVPERMRSGDYIRRLISGKNNTKKDAEAVSWYDVPERGHFGNLACVKYVAGKPQSIRRPYYKVADLRPSDIKNDVKFLSYYQKNRQAAADASRALETEWSESIVKREVKPILEEKTNVAEKKTNLPEEKITVPEEKKTVAEETKAVAEEKVTVVEEKKVIAEEKETLIEEKKALVEEPIKEEVKPKAKLAKESKIKKSKQVEVEKKVETKVETPKVKEIPVKEPSKESEELLAEPAKEKEEKVEEEVATTESLESTQKQLEIVEEPPKEEPSKEVPVEIEVAKVQESENLSEEKTEEKATIEPKVESTVESKIEPTVETAAIDTAEIVEESKPEIAQEVETKSVEEAEIIEATPTTENTELVSEKDQPEGETEEVKQNRQDAAKRAEEYLLKVAEESRTEEEKKQAVEIQLTKYEMEEEKAWEALQIDLDRKAHLDEILEVERAEAERKIEEEKLEKERTEIIRLEEAERQINAEKLRALMEEEERMLIEERAEEVRQRQEREERLAEVSLGISDDKKDADYSREDQLFTEITDQEMEEKPYELPPTDEDTKIEEENVVEYEVEDISMDPFVEEPDGQSRPVPSGGTAIVEENFEWPDEEA
uniref:calponin homology domain-containing protein DDB_G0272472-like isoform X2 n=1 Tax=Vespula vulgaris TaxID=7454 RepID=UPI00223BA5F6|nr:calponin homology domain-containing protein DDB_G0272472-like isoform X2 [Vespula vulgaris]